MLTLVILNGTIQTQNFEGIQVISSEWINKNTFNQNIEKTLGSLEGTAFFEPLMAAKKVYMAQLADQQTAADLGLIIIKPEVKVPFAMNWWIPGIVVTAVASFFIGYKAHG